MVAAEAMATIPFLAETVPISIPATASATRTERFRRSFNRAGKAITAMIITSAVHGAVTIERPLGVSPRAPNNRFFGSVVTVPDCTVTCIP